MVPSELVIISAGRSESRRSLVGGVLKRGLRQRHPCLAGGCQWLEDFSWQWVGWKLRAVRTDEYYSAQLQLAMSRLKVRIWSHEELRRQTNLSESAARPSPQTAESGLAERAQGLQIPLSHCGADGFSNMQRPQRGVAACAPFFQLCLGLVSRIWSGTFGKYGIE